MPGARVQKLVRELHAHARNAEHWAREGDCQGVRLVWPKAQTAWHAVLSGRPSQSVAKFAQRDWNRVEDAKDRACGRVSGSVSRHSEQMVRALYDDIGGE